MASTDDTLAPPAPRRTRIQAANTDRILDAAVEAFGRHGFRGSTIDEIAEAAGMSKTNLLYYFRSKQELYTAVLARLLHMWLEPLRELDAEKDPADALSHYIRVKLSYSRTHATGSRLFAMEIMQGAPMLEPILRDELDALVKVKVEILGRWIGEGRLKPVDPYHLLFAIWAVTQHYADFAIQVSTLTGKDLSDETFFEETVEAVTRLILGGALA